MLLTPISSGGEKMNIFAYSNPGDVSNQLVEFIINILYCEWGIEKKIREGKDFYTQWITIFYKCTSYSLI